MNKDKSYMLNSKISIKENCKFVNKKHYCNSTEMELNKEESRKKLHKMHINNNYQY